MYNKPHKDLIITKAKHNHFGIRSMEVSHLFLIHRSIFAKPEAENIAKMLIKGSLW